jgi:4-hydroxybenzoyl-CoA thioesterase
MPGHRREHVVQWGECDPMGIVFYPNFFRWMDEASWAMYASHGLYLPTLEERWGVVGTPLVETGCAFKNPARQDDKLVIDTRVTSWATRSFRVGHTFSCDGRAVAEGFEVRVWTVRDPARASGLAAAAIPDAFKRLIDQGGGG